MTVEDAKARLNRGPAEPITGFVGVSDIQASYDDLQETWTSDIAAATFGGDGGENVTGVVGSAVTTGGADQTAVLQAEINALHTAGGGTLVLPRGTIRVNGVLSIPNDGAAKAVQAPIRIIGQGCFFAGSGVTPISGAGTVLDIRGTHTHGKITTVGLGLLAVIGVTFTDSAGTNTPFLYTTNTTLHVDQCAFVGTKSTTNCDQDAIVCGGTTNTYGGHGLDDAFQGYGTIISRNYFAKIRRAVYGRTFFNAVIVRDNTVWASCGSNDATGGAAFEMDGGPDNCTGNVFTNNLVEMPGYIYSFKATKSQRNAFVANNVYDTPTRCVAGYYFSDTAWYNTVIDGYTSNANGTLFVLDANTTPKNTAMTSAQSVYSVYPEPIRAINTSYYNQMSALHLVGGFGTNSLLIKSDTAMGTTGLPIRVVRSDAETTDPGATAFEVTNRGKLTCGGPHAGQINFQNWDGTMFAQFLDSGQSWVASGSPSNMQISVGTSASVIDMRGYSVRVSDHNSGPLRVTIGAGIDGIKLGLAADATVVRAAADTVNVGKLAVTNTVAATTPGTVARRMEVFNAAGASLGFIPIYDTIT